jgi:hypothetical protein
MKKATRGVRRVPAHDNSFTSEDRDLLITLREGMASLKSTVEELRETYRTDDLVRAKDFNTWKGEVNTKIEDLQKFRWWIVGAAACAGVVAHWLFKF